MKVAAAQRLAVMVEKHASLVSSTGASGGLDGIDLAANGLAASTAA